MDSRDKMFLKVFVALYVSVTALAGIGGTAVPPWRVGVYGALLGTLLVWTGLVVRGRLASSPTA